MSPSAVVRPISFVTPLIRAVLDGRKTQTRRLIRPQPESVRCHAHQGPLSIIGDQAKPCRFGRVGDQLWVQERWADVGDSTLFDASRDGIVYAADLVLPLKGRWKPARFMPRRHSRITLTIESVRIERLAAISAREARDEGFDPTQDGVDPIAWFQKIWDDLSDDTTGWNANPWVWVIEFCRTMPTASPPI